MIPTPAAALVRQPLQWDPRQISGQRVAVVGLGRFGGGAGAARFLLSHGADVVVTDLLPRAELGETVGELESLGAEMMLGGHCLETLSACQWIVASPAVPPSAPPLRMAAEAGIPVETEISLLVRLLPKEWLGITGTNGKSTTAKLAASMLEPVGPTWLGGNLGGSLLSHVGDMPVDAKVVLELSSFQLEHLNDVGLGPSVAVITNVSPDHLDRHGSMQAYVRAKAAILRRARTAVLNYSDPHCRRLGERFPGAVRWFGSGPSSRLGGDRRSYSLRGDRILCEEPGKPPCEFSLPETQLLGTHNNLNVIAAAAACEAFGARFVESLRRAAAVTPIPGRLQEVGRANGVRFVDDSVSTSPPAVLAALRSLESGIHLLLGGYDKGIGVEELLDEIPRRCRKLHLFGAVSDHLKRKLRQRGWESRPKPCQSDALPMEFEVYPDLPAAFAGARKTALPGETILLSPGFASYDQFRCFAERGELFRKLVAAALP